MAVIRAFKGRMRRIHSGINTGGEIFLMYVDRVFAKVFHVSTNFCAKARAKRMRSVLWHKEDRTYHIKDIRFPELNEADERLLLNNILDDTFCSYYYFGDKYDEATVDYCDVMLNEGLYGLVNEKVNVTVEPGDIVIDAGAWIGDFAAYASVKGATCYAFEPSDSNFAILEKMAELNGNIIPVKKGLSDVNTSMTLFAKTGGTSEMYSLMQNSAEKQEALRFSSSRIRLSPLL